MRIFLLLVLILTACDKPVSEKQREALREEMKNRKPVRISEEQIIAKTFDEARKDLKDTVVTQYRWKEFYVKPADSTLAELWLAYEYAFEQGFSLTDNVQLTESTIIYTRPRVAKDSVLRMDVALIPKKDIVLKISSQ